MKNVQIIDGARNATHSVFQATEDEFDQIFPKPQQDMEFIEDFFDRMEEQEAIRILNALWTRPILKRDAMGIHGTLYYEYEEYRHSFPQSRREVDLDPSWINAAQRAHFAKHR